MTAHDGSDHAERAEQREIGDATLEQLRGDVTSVARDYVTGEPFRLFLEMRRIRSRIYAALDRRLWPRDEAELYFLLGGLNGLMANAAIDLGYPRSADELARAGWAYAVVIDHRPMMGFLRGLLVDNAYWQGRARQAHALAAAGLRYAVGGPGAARLHLYRARAAAAYGDAEETRGAIRAAEEARQHGHGDDLDEIGGEFAFLPARQACLVGHTLSNLTGSEASAAEELRNAIRLYQAMPAEERSYGSEAIAHINLAIAQVRGGDLDAVDLQPVFSLPADKRIDALTPRLAAVRNALASPRYQGSPEARDLDEQIEDFGHETIVAALHDLPAGPG